MNRRGMLAGMALGTAGVAISAHADASTLEAQHLVERFASTLTAHDMSAFADLFADDYRNHQTSAAAPVPPAGKSAKQNTVEYFAARLAGMPDLVVTVETSLLSTNRFAASCIYTGTHAGTFMGVPPTGKKLRFTSCDIFTFRDYKLLEHWGMGDIAGVLAQLKA